jgi:hypothetical protein
MTYRPIGPCACCGMPHYACVCHYFHLSKMRTPFVLQSHLDFTKTPEQIASEQHSQDG